MSSAVKILPHYTYEDWVRWEGQWELIDGIPYAMSPAPVPNHQRVGSNLIIELGQALKQCKNYCKVYQPIDYKVKDDTILQPDVLVVCGEIKAKFLDRRPFLVVEVLSPSTALKDRHTKFDIYQSEKVPYYLIVDSDLETVEVYQLVNDEYQQKDKGRDIQFEFQFEDCKALIHFKEIWD